MPIPPGKQVHFGVLTPATPSPFTPAVLKAQLENIGLNCAQITPQNLTSYIATVNSQLPRGQVQSFAIKAPGQSVTLQNLGLATPWPLTNALTANGRALTDAVPPSADVAVGNWTITGDPQGYSNILEVLQYPDHFNWLYDHRASNGFTGVKQEPPAYTGNYPSAEGIQQLFVQVCTNASATLVKGLDQDTMRAVLTNVIQPLQDATLSNYDQSDSRSIFLVENYNASTGYCDALGVLSVWWRLIISDYKRKTKDGGDTHPTNLTIKAAAVTYSDTTIMCAHYNAVLKQFGIDPSTAPACTP